MAKVPPWQNPENSEISLGFHLKSGLLQTEEFQVCINIFYQHDIKYL